MKWRGIAKAAAAKHYGGGLGDVLVASARGKFRNPAIRSPAVSNAHLLPATRARRGHFPADR